MNSVILCEGETDAILISYYLMKVYGWGFSKNNKSEIKIPIDKNNQSVDWYNLNNNNLLIFSVGGKSRFNDSIRKIIEINRLNDKSFENIIVVTDRDSTEREPDITNSLKNEFCKIDTSFNLFNREWTRFKYNNLFSITCETRVSCLIIPFDKSGALETFLLDSLSEDLDKKYIIDMCKEFVYNIKSNIYVNSDRLKLKAQLGVTFAILSPQKVFTELDSIIRSVPWENYKTIQHGFSLFDALR